MRNRFPANGRDSDPGEAVAPDRGASEGTLGASTVMWGGRYGGSCPLNCTHVWNYEQTLSRLFPALERDMRDTEYDVMQAPEGYIPTG
ncbi:hypothetical protein ACFPJ1_04545 [Kribbella qitaiheensis]|uniref:hypothetical protein n=1 Tax=Kribbella qitaiheensis TaxID=1544730 RepID=UPI00361F7A63